MKLTTKFFFYRMGSSHLVHVLYIVHQVMAAAQRGYQSHGVELNSVLVLYSKLSAWRQQLRNATFSRQDLFKIDYSQYNNVVIFGVDEMVNGV